MEYTNLYHSSVVNNTDELDSLIDKLLNYHPEDYATTVLGESTSIDLKTYFLSLVRIPFGNFIIYRYSNGPTGVTTSPIQMSIVEMEYQGVFSQYQIIVDLNKIYLRDCSSFSAKWIDISNQTNSGIELVAIHRGETEPSVKSGLWVKPNGELHLFSESKQEWISPSIDDMLSMSVYNQNRITESPSEYYDAKTQYDEFIQHTENKFTLIHVSALEKDYFDNIILSKEDFAAIVNRTKAQMIQEITNKYNEVTGYANNKTIYDTTKAAYDGHIDVHLNETDFDKWSAKADADHTHTDASLHRVQISGADIVSGTISPSKLPDEIKERVYKIDNMDDLASEEAAALRTSKYHTGNKLVYTNNSLESKDYIWYRIADQSKIGTSEYMDGLHKFRATAKNEIRFADISATPETLDGYGITDGVTITDFNDTMSSQYNITAEKKVADSLNSYAPTPVSTKSFKNALIAYVGFQEKPIGDETYPILPNSKVDILILTDTNVLYRSRITEDFLGFTEFNNMGSCTEEEFFEMFPVSENDIFSNPDNPNWESYRLGAGFKISRGQLNTPRYFDFYPDDNHIQIGVRVTPTTMIIEDTKFRKLQSMNASLVHTNEYISLVKTCETISFEDILNEIYGTDR